MAGNVSQKEQTLNEIIDWCEQLAAEGLRLASALLRQHAHGSTESKREHEMSRAIRYVECVHCGETVGTCYVTCPYFGYRLAVHSLPPREKCAD